MPEPNPHAWDPVAGEPQEAYAAFQYYRECGSTRSKAATGRAVRASYAAISRWAVDWFWEDRVDDFDRAQSAARDAEYARLNAAGAERWAQQAKLINDLAAEITLNELRALQKRQQNGQEMTPAELSRFMRETTQQGNLAAGKPTSRLDNQINLANLSEEDRSALELLRPALERIAKGSGE